MNVNPARRPMNARDECRARIGQAPEDARKGQLEAAKEATKVALAHEEITSFFARVRL
jgi:hypothetical protein